MGAEVVELLFVSLFGITIVGFIVAVNSRGTVKMAFSYVMATVLLIATVYELVSYLGESRLHRQMAQAQAMEEARRAREEEEQRKLAVEYGGFLKTLATKGKQVASRLRRSDLMDESIEMETFFARSAAAKREISGLAKELAGRKAPEKNYALSRSTLEKALEKTKSSARYLSLYFKSEDEDQEERRGRVFYSHAREAISLYDKVDIYVAQKK